MTIYLVDEPFVDIAVSYAVDDNDSNIVLLQDAVYASSRVRVPGKVYVMNDDVERRGIESSLPSTVRVIRYEQLIEMMEKEKVVNFL